MLVTSGCFAAEGVLGPRSIKLFWALVGAFGEKMEDSEDFVRFGHLDPLVLVL